jgi:hypothetical protein
MNILNAIFKTACRLDEWNGALASSGNISQFTKEMSTAKTKLQQKSIIKTMVSRIYSSKI